MQTYPIALTPQNPSGVVMASADLIVYESGATVPVGGDSRIVVKPDNGSEIVLRAGQSMRLPAGTIASTWTYRSNDPTQTINGSIIIGSGEFDDNSFKIDANSGAVPVIPQGGFQIANADAQPVPSKIVNTVANRVPVTMDVQQILQTSGSTVAVQSGYQATGVTPVGITEVVPKAANQFGMVINKLFLTINQSAGYDSCWFVQNAAGQTVYLHYAVGNANKASELTVDTTQWVIPPGYGLYLSIAGSGQGGFKGANYTMK